MILHKTSLGTFRKFVPITKIDVSRREVYGVVTAEVPDKDNEVCDYASTKPEYMKWSADIAKASNGKNMGNLREMHGLSAVGAGKALDFDDSAKLVRMGFRVVDDQAWKKCMEGVYTGFSQGGSYVKTWKQDGMTHYTARPSEVSLVDNPCLSTATFEFIRADGSSEMRKFAASVLQKDGVLEDVDGPKDEKEEKPAEKAEGITDEGGHVCSECGQTIAPKEVKKEETVVVIEPEPEGSPEGEVIEEEIETPEEKNKESVEGEEPVDEDLEECSGVAKVNVQAFKSPVTGKFSYTPDEICGEIQYHNNMARASMLANEMSLSEAHQIMACMWEDRGAAAMPPSNPEVIAFDPNEVTDLLESVNLPAAVYKIDPLQELTKSATIEVESLLQSVGM